MNIELVLIAASLHILIWEKLPDWFGVWHDRALAALPRPLRWLHEKWRCPYCAGFWFILVLHGLTGIWTLPAMAGLPLDFFGLGLVLGWFFDAMAGAILIIVLMLSIHALSLPGMKARLLEGEMRTASGEPKSR